MSLQGRTTAVVISVAFCWFQFRYSSSFVSADFFRSVELSDHLVNLGKTFAKCVIVIPPANCVGGWVYCFHVVRPSDRVCVCACVRYILFP